MKFVINSFDCGEDIMKVYPFLEEYNPDYSDLMGAYIIDIDNLEQLLELENKTREVNKRFGSYYQGLIVSFGHISIYDTYCE